MRFLIPCLLLNTGRKERELILSGYERGDYRAIIANRVLNEGIDVPAAKVGIVIGGTGSPSEAIQRLGRVLRKRKLETANLVRSRLQRDGRGRAIAQATEKRCLPNKKLSLRSFRSGDP